MKLEMVTWTIRGYRALMQSNPAVMVRQEGGLVTKKKDVLSPVKEAEAQLYVNDRGEPYHPGMGFWRVLFVACPNRTLGGKAAHGIVAAAILPCEDEFVLYDPTTLDSKKPRVLRPSGKNAEWCVDQRAVPCNGAKKGAIIACRPKWPVWGGLLTFEVDMEMVGSLAVFTELLNMAGRFGVGCGRLKQEPNKSVWGGLGIGKFEAELRNGKG